MTARSGKVPLKTRIAFSAGALEEAVMSAAGVATMLFYNQVLGVSAYLCGIVFLVASVIDAVSDPLIGAWSDSFRSRWGRRHPFMLAAVIPVCLGFLLLYTPPENMSETFYFWWFMAAMSLMRIGKTLFVVPHDALGAELTDDYHERTAIFGLNTVAGMLGAAVLAVLVLVVVFPSTPGFENGLLNPAGYPVMAYGGATLMLVMLAISIAGTRDQIPRLHDVRRQAPRIRESLGDLLALLTSRSYLSVCVAWLVMLVSGGILGVVATYTFLYGFELTTEELSIQRFVTIPGMFVALPLAAWFTRKFDKKQTVILTCVVCATLVGLPHTLKLVGLFPANDSAWMLPCLFGSLFLGYLLLPVVPITIDSQLADIADEHEYRTGRRAEGVIFSVRTFALKATAGVGGMLGGLGLELIDFPDNASQQNLTPEMLDGLFFMCGPLYWLIVGLGMLFMGLYNIDKDRHARMISALRARRLDDSEPQGPVAAPTDANNREDAYRA